MNEQTHTTTTAFSPEDLQCLRESRDAAERISSLIRTCGLALRDHYDGRYEARTADLYDIHNCMTFATDMASDLYGNLSDAVVAEEKRAAR